MLILEYDTSPGISAEMRIQSLKESVQRALEEISTDSNNSVASVQKVTVQIQRDFDEYKVLYAEELKAHEGEFEEIRADVASFEKTYMEYLFAEDGTFRFVQIDKTNIDEAWIGDLLVKGKFIADNINAATGSFSRYLTGVNIVGDNITGGTISTERLIIRDPDSNTGILYEINNGIVEQANLTEEQLKRLTLDGRIITAESITAEKINVADLFSQNITATGDFNLGSGGALVYDAETDTITIRASRISIGGKGAATTEEVKTVKNAALIEAYDEYATGSDKTTVPPSDAWSTDQPVAGNGIFIWQRRVSVYGNNDVVYGSAVCITGNVGEKGEDAAVLRIDSSRGTVFKNNAVTTVLSVTVYYGSQRITNITDLRAAFGSGAYLEWKWQKVNEESFGTILSTDSRLSNDGFTFSLTPADVDTKVTFLCNLIV